LETSLAGVDVGDPSDADPHRAGIGFGADERDTGPDSRVKRDQLAAAGGQAVTEARNLAIWSPGCYDPASSAYTVPSSLPAYTVPPATAGLEST
jgi:hypothetical protein